MKPLLEAADVVGKTRIYRRSAQRLLAYSGY
jgi:hypothetical protein